MDEVEVEDDESTTTGGGDVDDVRVVVVVGFLMVVLVEFGAVVEVDVDGGGLDPSLTVSIPVIPW